MLIKRFKVASWQIESCIANSLLNGYIQHWRRDHLMPIQGNLYNFSLAFRYKVIIMRNFSPLNWTSMVIKPYIREKLLRLLNYSLLLQQFTYQVQNPYLMLTLVINCRSTMEIPLQLMDVQHFSAEIDFHMLKNMRFESALDAVVCFFMQFFFSFFFMH